MSQAAPNAPSVVLSAASGRQQVPLRDYLNARVAPFLKKAITESLGAEAEFPLQWLGECLIHQSILYEGNPDRTNIRERFLYKFDDPKPQEPTNPEPAPSAPAEVPPPAAQPEPIVEHPGTLPPTQQQSEVSMNDTSEQVTEQVAPTQASDVAPTQQEAGMSEPPTINGVKEEGGAHEARDSDAEMGGT